jgi:DNA-binding NarL/FixJ family response regulator
MCPFESGDLPDFPGTFALGKKTLDCLVHLGCNRGVEGITVPDEQNASTSILIVDADKSARKLAAEILRDAGYPTLQAESGEEALAIATNERPCLVILEVSLPGISGYDVCRKLREAFGEQVSIVFLSGVRKESFDRVAGLLLGADDYIVKPFAPDELVARVRGLTRRSVAPTEGVDSRLTKREREVLQLLAEGLDQKEVADRLFISPSTVGTHTEHIFAKLGVNSRSQALALAYRGGLIGRRSLISLAVLPIDLLNNDFLLESVSALGTSFAA